MGAWSVISAATVQYVWVLCCGSYSAILEWDFCLAGERVFIDTPPTLSFSSITLNPYLKLLGFIYKSATPQPQNYRNPKTTAIANR